MTKWEYDKLMNIIDKAIQDERKCCEGYIALNPGTADERKKVAMYITDAMSLIRYKIADEFKNKLN